MQGSTWPRLETITGHQVIEMIQVSMQHLKITVMTCRGRSGRRSCSGMHGSTWPRQKPG